LIATFGTQRDRYQSAEEMLFISGIAPHAAKWQAADRLTPLSLSHVPQAIVSKLTL